MNIVLIGSIAALALVLLFSLLSVPTRWGLGVAKGAGGEDDATRLPESLRTSLGRALPSSAVTVGALPSLPIRASLQDAPPVPSPTADLSAVGVGDARDVADGDLWRAVRSGVNLQNRGGRA